LACSRSLMTCVLVHILWEPIIPGLTVRVFPQRVKTHSLFSPPGREFPIKNAGIIGGLHCCDRSQGIFIPGTKMKKVTPLQVTVPKPSRFNFFVKTPNWTIRRALFQDDREGEGRRGHEPVATAFDRAGRKTPGYLLGVSCPGCRNAGWQEGRVHL